MPVAGAAARMEDYYPALFPEAVERIRAGARWLADKGYRKIVLLSHSMGSWMSNVYFEQTESPRFAAWVNMGLTGGFGDMTNVRVPVLDLYGEHDLAQVTRAGWRRRFTLRSIEGSKQVMIAGADHHYTGHEKELDRAIREFIGTLR
jgi:alpha/beta superfamily hydrolase